MSGNVSTEQLRATCRGKLDSYGYLDGAERIAREHGATLDEVLVPSSAPGSRVGAPACARRAIAKSLADAGEGFSVIGRLLGRDRTTAMYLAGARDARRPRRAP